MASLRMDQIQTLQMRQELRQMLRMEQANLLELSEEEFSRLVADLERDPLFQRLNRQERIVRYQRFPGIDISPSFYELKEEIAADRGSLDIESLLAAKGAVVQLIQELGLERFNQYFLYPEPGLTLEEVARECDMEVSKVREINDLINEFSVQSEFYHPSAISEVGGLRYAKVASVERGSEGFVLCFNSPAHARGKYAIDYEGFEKLVREGALTEGEAGKARLLFKKLELINSRKDTLTRILLGVMEKQALYLESGDPKALLPFSQKELARKTGLFPSSISRAIRGKSLDTPWGEEIPLKDFFPHPRRFREQLLRQLLETEELPSDEAARARLEARFGVAISRRGVASLRKRLGLPPGRGRKKPPAQDRRDQG